MERSSPPPPKPSLGTAIALIVVGLVIFVPSGLCTGLFALWQSGTGSNFSINFVPLLIGGPFVVGGGVLLWIGFKNLLTYFRKSRTPDQF